MPVPEYKVSTLCSGTKVDTEHSTALFSLLSSCFKMASDSAKWNNYVHSQLHVGYSKCEHNTILCRYPGTGSARTKCGEPLRVTYRVLKVWTPFCACTHHYQGPSVDSPLFLHLFFLFQALLLIGRWMEETAYYEPNRVIQQYKVELLCLSSH